MKTTIKTFERGNKTITLVGVCHVGTKSYYDKIQKELDRKDHDVVLYEGVKGFEEIKLNNLYQFLADIADLVPQKQAIHYRCNWIRSDLDKGILLSADPSFLSGMPKDIDQDLENLKNNWLLKLIVSFLLKLSNIIRFLHIKDKAVMLDLRNYKIIMDTFSALIEYDKVCLFYGQGHVYGIENYIKRVGFVRSKEYRLKCF